MASFVSTIDRIPAARWHEPHAPGKWSPAEEVLHVARTYEIAIAGVKDGIAMAPRLSPARMTVLRWLLVPVILRTAWFPHGAAAPREVRPEPLQAGRLSPADLTVRLRQASEDAMRHLQAAAAKHPQPQLVHAYFGALSPLTAARFVSAHTRHHLRQLAARYPSIEST